MVTEIEIHRFEKVMLLIRKSVGWSAEEFGDRIGVTRQTINNLESGRCRLTKTQYIAMRSVLDKEMEDYPDETEMLKIILDAFVDHPENYKQKTRDEIYRKAALLSPAIINNPSKRKEISKEWKKILVGLGIIAATALSAILVGSWRKRL